MQNILHLNLFILLFLFVSTPIFALTQENHLEGNKLHSSINGLNNIELPQPRGMGMIKQGFDITAYMTPVKGADYYIVSARVYGRLGTRHYVDLSKSFGVKSSYTSSTHEYIIFPDMPYGEYDFTYKACNVSGCSIESEPTWRLNNGDSQYTIQPPTLTRINSNTIQIDVNIQAYSVVRIALQVKENGGNWTNIGSALNTRMISDFDVAPDKYTPPDTKVSATFEVLSDNSSIQSRQFRIAECQERGSCSFYSDISNISLSPLNIPVLTHITSQSYDDVIFTWDSDSNANFYELEKFNEFDGQWKTIATSIVENVYKIENLAEGLHQYRLRACDSAFCSLYSIERTVDIKKPIPPIIPLSVFTVHDGVNINLTWSPVPNATRYEIEMREADSTWQNVTTSHYRPRAYRETSVTSALFANQTTGSRQFRVAACNTIECSDYSLPSEMIEFGMSPQIPSAPIGVQLGSEINVHWSAVPNAKTYAVEISTNFAQWIDYSDTLNFVSPTSIKLTNATTPLVRIFRVIACNANACSLPSLQSNWLDSTGHAVTTPSIPMQPKSAVLNDTMLIDWPDVAGADSYQVEASLNNANWENVTNMLTFSRVNQFKLSGLSSGDRRFRVAACNQGNCSSFSESSKPALILAIPKNLKVTLIDDRVKFTWQAMPETLLYKISINHDDNGWNFTSTTTNNSFSHNPHLIGKYQYRAAACSKTHSGTEFCSAWSTTSSFILPKMEVKTFEWQPAEVEMGKPIKLIWDIVGADSCYDTTYGVSTPLERAASGQTEEFIYQAPEVHVTQWYCLDVFGNRFPNDEYEYIEATRTVITKPQKNIKIHTELIGVPLQKND